MLEPVTLALPCGDCVSAFEVWPDAQRAPRAIVIFAPGSCGGMGPGLTDTASASQFDASVRSIYTLVAERAAALGVASMIHSYREPPIDHRNVKNSRSSLVMGVEDCMAAVQYMTRPERVGGNARIILVGFSYGGAVVLGAAGKLMEDRNLRQRILGLALLGSATGGIWWRERADDRLSTVCPSLGGLQGILSQLAGNPVLVVHGIDDKTLPVSVARDLYMHAKEPKGLALIEGGSHRMGEAKKAVTKFLLEWLTTITTNRSSVNVGNLGPIRIKKATVKRRCSQKKQPRKVLLERPAQPGNVTIDCDDEARTGPTCDTLKTHAKVSAKTVCRIHKAVPQGISDHAMAYVLGSVGECRVHDKLPPIW